MHGTLPRPQRQKTANRKAEIFGYAVLAILAGLAVLNGTPEGHDLLLKWGFIYPPDCG
jgi:hypothetical protein